MLVGHVSSFFGRMFVFWWFKGDLTNLDLFEEVGRISESGLFCVTVELVYNSEG